MTTAPALARPVRHIPLVEVTRGPLIEGVHYGSFAVVSPEGHVLAEGGDGAAPMYPRSALKPLQAVAMVRAGLDLPDHLLALSAASHSGAPIHRAGAREILEMHGTDAAALRNVQDLPYCVAERLVFVRGGGEPSRLAQNCSGKHAAMIATCLINGWSTDDYLRADHPLQRLVEATVADLTGERAVAVTVDGCGTPLLAHSLRGMARAYARLATAPDHTAEARVAAAMRAFPQMVAGEERDVTTMMRAVPGFIAKDGAEGVQLGGLATSAVGIAVKVSDGGDRARSTITASILEALGVDQHALTQLRSAPVLGGGEPVGTLRTVAGIVPRLNA
ncbi:asparaginase [Microbacterium sp. F1-18]